MKNNLGGYIARTWFVWFILLAIVGLSVAMMIS
jgi:hypothetical protein